MPASKKTPEVMEEIVRRMSDGESLRGICRDDHMPSIWTVVDWQRDDEEFAHRCARARELQAEVMDEKILSVADRVERGVMDPQSAKVALSAYQWRAAKLAPKKFGDKLETTHQLGDSVSKIVREIVRG